MKNQKNTRPPHTGTHWLYHGGLTALHSAPAQHATPSHGPSEHAPPGAHPDRPPH